jgi:hypothetical protein
MSGFEASDLRLMRKNATEAAALLRRGSAGALSLRKRLADSLRKAARRSSLCPLTSAQSASRARYGDPGIRA